MINSSNSEASKRHESSRCHTSAKRWFVETSDEGSILDCTNQVPLVIIVIDNYTAGTVWCTKNIEHSHARRRNPSGLSVAWRRFIMFLDSI